MIVRVVVSNGEFIGEFETTNPLPAKGDTFWYGTDGPYTVVDRAFIYKKSDQGAPAHDAILTIEEFSKHRQN